VLDERPVGRPADVTVRNAPRGPRPLRGAVLARLRCCALLDPQQDVRQGLIVQIEPDGRVARASHAGGSCTIDAEPRRDVKVWLAMLGVSDWRRYIDNPLDKLGLLQPVHRLIPSFKLDPSQAVAVLQGGNDGDAPFVPLTAGRSTGWDSAASAACWIVMATCPPCDSNATPDRAGS
jgi:hypothetical protein